MNTAPVIQSDAELTHRQIADDSCSLLCFVRREKVDVARRIIQTLCGLSQRRQRNSTAERDVCALWWSQPFRVCTLFYVRTYSSTYNHIYIYIYALPFLSPSQRIRDAEAWHSLHKHAASFVYSSRLSANNNYQFKVCPWECFVSRYHLRFK